MSAADFLHGPIAMLTEMIPMLTFAPKGATRKFMLDLTRRLRRQGSDVLSFTNDAAVARQATYGIYCPFEIEEGLSPLPLGAMGQLFACYLAVARGVES